MLDRIKALCKEKGISVHQLEMGAGLSNASIKYWANGCPRADKLKAVADYLGVSMEFLMTGEEKPVNNDGLSFDERTILALFRHLDADSQRKVIAQAQALILSQPSPGAPGES